MEDEIMQATNSSHNAMGIKNYVIARFLYAVIDDVLMLLSDLKESPDQYFKDGLFDRLSHLDKTGLTDSSKIINLLLEKIKRRALDYNLPTAELLRRLCSRSADLIVEKQYYNQFQDYFNQKNESPTMTDFNKWTNSNFDDGEISGFEPLFKIYYDKIIKDDESEIQLTTNMSSRPINDLTFERCDIPREVPIDGNENSNVSGVKASFETYFAKFRGSFNLKWDHPHNPTNIEAYEKCTMVHAKAPCYREPYRDEEFPPILTNLVIRQPSYVSILPLLISARHNKVNIQDYHIISERYSFRKIAMNKEDYVISVQKIGNTVFLRRHDERPDTMNDVGHRFERLCMPDYNIEASYYQLIEGNIGNLRTLISGETDAVVENEHAIELKCSKRDTMNSNYLDQPWLQTFLSGVDVIVFGTWEGADSREQIKAIQYFLVKGFIEESDKNQMLQRLHDVLQFLTDRVKEDKVYLLSRRYDLNKLKRDVYLYEVASQDQPNLTFISSEMSDKFINNDSMTAPQDNSVTELESDPVIEPQSDPVTEPQDDPVSEPQSDPVTKPQSDNKSWTIIKTWLNPTVQKKVHFIHSADELSEFIDPSVLPKRLNGNQPDFKYIPPTIEDEAMYNAFRADTKGKTIAE
ncbi:unnamed protein product, partial [Adineta steineri]